MSRVRFPSPAPKNQHSIECFFLCLESVDTSRRAFCLESAPRITRVLQNLSLAAAPSRRNKNAPPRPAKFCCRLHARNCPIRKPPCVRLCYGNVSDTLARFTAAVFLCTLFRVFSPQSCPIPVPHAMPPHLVQSPLRASHAFYRIYRSPPRCAHALSPDKPL